MTAQEFIKGCEHDGSYIPVGEVIRLMTEFSRLMCTKQKEICLSNAQIIKAEVCLCSVERKSILNAPYPEELL